MFRDQGADCSTKEWNLLIEVTEFEILDTTKFESWKYEHRAPHGHALFFSLDILVTPTAPLLCYVPFLKCVLGYYWAVSNTFIIVVRKNENPGLVFICLRKPCD